MVLVEPFCILFPFTSRYIFKFCTSDISSLVTKQGPVGPKVSHDLPLVHCPSLLIWNSLSETSLTTQYPAMCSSASFSLSSAFLFNVSIILLIDKSFVLALFTALIIFSLSLFLTSSFLFSSEELIFSLTHSENIALSLRKLLNPQGLSTPLVNILE